MSENIAWLQFGPKYANEFLNMAFASIVSEMTAQS